MSGVPVVLIGSGLGVLGALRLLRASGIKTYCYGEPGVERYSRWYAPLPNSAPVAANPIHFANALARSGLQRAVLMPCNDAAVKLVGELPPSLSKQYPASVAPVSVTRQLGDKAAFSILLDDANVPKPYTRIIDNVADLDEIPERIFERAFLKPRDSQSFSARYQLKGLFVSSRNDAKAKLAEPLDQGFEMVLQEFIPSGGDHILIDGFADRNGRIRGMLARRRKRMFPLDLGNTSHMESIPLAAVEQPRADLARLIAHLGYRGIFSGEFKQDPRDGVYKLLEINARVWWFVEYTGRCGLDTCRMSYLDALELPVPEITDYRTGEKFVHTYYDLLACRALVRSGGLSWSTAAKSWLLAQDPLLNWRDPRPAIVETAKCLAGLVRKQFVARASRPAGAHAGGSAVGLTEPAGDRSSRLQPRR